MEYSIDLTRDDIFGILNKALDEGVISDKDVLFEVATRYGSCFDDHHKIVEKCMEEIGCQE